MFNSVIPAQMSLLPFLLCLGVSIVLGLGLAILMDMSPVAEKALYPLVIASQTIPTTALAPLFVLWFGYTIWSKVLVTVLMTFVPVTITVFDGFRTAGNPGSRSSHANVRVVYTPEGETADAYIERLAAEIGKNDRVSVVTGDTMIRISAMRSGVLRISPEEFMLELAEAEKQMDAILLRTNLLAHQTRGEDAMRGKKAINQSDAGDH